MAVASQHDAALIPPPNGQSNPSWASESYPPPSLGVPPELLGEIFLHCACEGWSAFSARFVTASAAGSRWGGSLHPPIQSWIRVSHVCRHWRDVALSSPQLWSHVILNVPAMAKECLVRSRGVPLYVYRVGKGGFTSKQQEVFQLVTRQFSRVRGLCIDAGTFDLGPLPKNVLEHISTPLLSTCILRGGRYNQLLDLIFDCDLPNLHDLEIPRSYSRAWYTLPLPSTLRYLAVSTTSTFGPPISQSRPPRDDFRELTRLIIQDLSDSTPNTFPRMSFHQLIFLYIYVRDSTKLFQYLRSFDFPPTTRIELHTFMWPPLKEVLDRCRCPPLRSVSIFVSLICQICLFEAWSKTYPVSRTEYTRKKAPSTFRLHCNQVLDQLDSPSNLSRIFADVETLSLSATSGVSTVGAFKSVSKHVRNVRNLGVDPTSAGQLMCGVEPESFWDLFPNLECITLRNLDWKDESWNLLLRCLREKAASGAKLSRLEIDNLILDGRDSRVFTGLVDNLKVVTIKV